MFYLSGFHWITCGLHHNYSSNLSYSANKTPDESLIRQGFWSFYLHFFAFSLRLAIPKRIGYTDFIHKAAPPCVAAGVDAGRALNFSTIFIK